MSYSSLVFLFFSSVSVPTGRVQHDQTSSSFWFWSFGSWRHGSSGNNLLWPSSIESGLRICGHPRTNRGGFVCSNTQRGFLHPTRFDRPTRNYSSLPRLANLPFLFLMIFQFWGISTWFLSMLLDYWGHFSRQSSSKFARLIVKTALALLPQGGWVWLGKVKCERQQEKGWSSKDWS